MSPVKNKIRKCIKGSALQKLAAEKRVMFKIKKDAVNVGKTTTSDEPNAEQAREKAIRAQQKRDERARKKAELFKQNAEAEKAAMGKPDVYEMSAEEKTAFELQVAQRRAKRNAKYDEIRGLIQQARGKLAQISPLDQNTCLSTPKRKKALVVPRALFTSPANRSLAELEAAVGVGGRNPPKMMLGKPEESEQKNKRNLNPNIIINTSELAVEKS